MTATLCVAAVIMLLTLTVPIAALAARTSQVVLIIFILVNLALIAIKHRGSPVVDYFRVPLFVPYLGVATSALLFATSLL